MNIDIDKNNLDNKDNPGHLRTPRALKKLCCNYDKFC